MPSLHPGVTAVETMIRNFIPIVDAFKLYGRPKRLISDKSDTASMLFDYLHCHTINICPTRMQRELLLKISRLAQIGLNGQKSLLTK